MGFTPVSQPMLGIIAPFFAPLEQTKKLAHGPSGAKKLEFRSVEIALKLQNYKKTFFFRFVAFWSGKIIAITFVVN